MYPFVPPEDIRREHDLMVRRELQRNYPQHHLYFRDYDPVNGVLMAIRRQLGRWLIAAGTRIEPGTRRSRENTARAGVPLAGHASRT